MGSNSQEWIKQCTYCHRVLRKDGQYQDFGFRGPINQVFEIPVSHTVCGDCYNEVTQSIQGADGRRQTAAATRP